MYSCPVVQMEMIEEAMFNNLQIEMVAQLEHEARLVAAAKQRRASQLGNAPKVPLQWRQWLLNQRERWFGSQLVMSANSMPVVKHVDATPQH